LRAAGRRLADDASRKEIELALAEVVSDFTRRWLGKEKTVRVTRQGDYVFDMDRPLVPEDLERIRRREYIRRIRAELAGGGSPETPEARKARREREIRALMIREFHRLDHGDSELEIMPRVLAELLDVVDGLISVAIYDERERSAKAATKAGDEIRYTEPRWTP
jgi:hypothetical protein